MGPFLFGGGRAVLRKLKWFFSKVDPTEQDVLLNEKY